MIRKIITIDAERCTGCGLCVTACHEGAIGMENGKAVLLRDDYCDGLGDCLPACPTGAISFEEREALPYDEAAVQANMAARGEHATPQVASPGPAAPVSSPCGCPGSMARSMAAKAASPACAGGAVPSRLGQWPVQIQLVPVNAPYFAGADILIAADCTAYAYGNFHAEFMAGAVTLIGCPKLDPVDYTEKLTAILRENAVRSVTVTRMSVPCCGGIERAVKQAVTAAGKNTPCRVVTFSPEGAIVNDVKS